MHHTNSRSIFCRQGMYASLISRAPVTQAQDASACPKTLVVMSHPMKYALTLPNLHMFKSFSFDQLRITHGPRRLEKLRPYSTHIHTITRYRPSQYSYHSIARECSEERQGRCYRCALRAAASLRSSFTTAARASGFTPLSVSSSRRLSVLRSSPVSRIVEISCKTGQAPDTWKKEHAREQG